MPIHGLTINNQSIAEGLPIIGKLRKGAEKTQANRPGADLDHFRFTANPEYQIMGAGDIFAELYGKEPRMFQNVLLPSNDIDVVFSAWLEMWGAGGTLKLRSDGKTVVREYRYLGDNKGYGYTDVPRPITEDELKDCNPVGRFNILMPQFIEELGVFGVVTVETHSKHDILKLHSYLDVVLRMYGKLTGIPFMFGRTDKEISIPNQKHKGARFMATKSLFTLEVMPMFVKQELLPAITRHMIAVETKPQLTEPKSDPKTIRYTPKTDARVSRSDRRMKTDDATYEALGLTASTDGSSALDIDIANDEPELEIMTDDDADVIELKTYDLVKVRSAKDLPGNPLRFITSESEVLNVYDDGKALLRDMGWQVSTWESKPSNETQNGFNIEVIGSANSDVLTIEKINTKSDELVLHELAQVELAMTPAEVTKWMGGNDSDDVFTTVDAWVTLNMNGSMDKARAHIEETGKARRKENSAPKA